MTKQETKCLEMISELYTALHLYNANHPLCQKALKFIEGSLEKDSPSYPKRKWRQISLLEAIENEKKAKNDPRKQ